MGICNKLLDGRQAKRKPCLLCIRIMLLCTVSTISYAFYFVGQERSSSFRLSVFATCAAFEVAFRFLRVSKAPLANPSAHHKLSLLFRKPTFASKCSSYDAPLFCGDEYNFTLL